MNFDDHEEAREGREEDEEDEEEAAVEMQEEEEGDDDDDDEDDAEDGGLGHKLGIRVQMLPTSERHHHYQPALVPSAASTKLRFRECMKNHAVGIGGHAVDGCGEFLPSGADGTLDSLKCAACNCHRNFHRKELVSPAGGAGELYLLPHHHYHGAGGQVPPQPLQITPYYRTPPPPSGLLQVGPTRQHYHYQQQHIVRPPLALPSPASCAGGRGGSVQVQQLMAIDQEDVSNPMSGGGDSTGGGGRSKRNKRFRSKFTQEQKEKMFGLAERLGWRIQKHDDDIVNDFCNEIGIKRQVLKVWMHNNKHTLGKKP